MYRQLLFLALATCAAAVNDSGPDGSSSLSSAAATSDDQIAAAVEFDKLISKIIDDALGKGKTISVPSVSNVVDPNILAIKHAMQPTIPVISHDGQNSARSYDEQSPVLTTPMQSDSSTTRGSDSGMVVITRSGEEAVLNTNVLTLSAIRAPHRAHRLAANAAHYLTPASSSARGERNPLLSLTLELAVRPASQRR